ncbi:DUF3796 domain-containing protein [Aquibacillus kalidii]|uniref:DUF3796 domain-containing protein n=1 Tax=Aquibacillus kalidii TaxID=2762597 RepID=UPI0016488A03|nr:DUF3796 domain-containing protein [Aquibacillus kalidii]
MKNKLAYLGFLGFIGFLGPFSFMGEDMSVAYFMFVFFFFFLYSKVEPDELFILNVQSAATKAFFLGFIFTTVVITFSFVIDNVSVLRLLFVITFAVSLLTFIISLELIERREKKDIEDGIYNKN